MRERALLLGVWSKINGEPVSYSLEEDTHAVRRRTTDLPKLRRCRKGIALWDGNRFQVLVTPWDFEDTKLVDHLLNAFGEGACVVTCTPELP